MPSIAARRAASSAMKRSTPSRGDWKRLSRGISSTRAGGARCSTAAIRNSVSRIDAVPDQSLTTAWRAVQSRAEELAAVPLRAMRDSDPQRGVRFSREAAGLYFDFSRQRIDGDGLRLLLGLAEAAGLRARIAAMWAGEPINGTEGRAALHTALRVPAASPDAPGGVEIAKQVLAERERMLKFATDVRDGGVRGSAGASFDTVINIGIGGSDLGPAM